MTANITLILFFIFILVFDSSSQVTQEWVARYNGPTNGSDDAYSIAVDNTGNIFVTGESLLSSTDYLTVKYNSAGVQQWSQRYNGPASNWDRAYSIAADQNGDVYVTGGSTANGGWDDYATVKYSSMGVQQWVRRYNGTADRQDIAYALVIDNTGSVIVTGQSIGTGSSDDYVTIKYNSSGEEQWVKVYNGPSNSIDYAQALAADNSGNVYVTGYSYGGSTYMDYLTIKYDSQGNEMWVARYSGPNDGTDRAYSVCVDYLGNVYVTGYSNQGANTILDYCTIKYNSSGIQQWVQIYNGPGNSYDTPHSIKVDSSCNVYVTGESFGYGTNFDFATIKYDSLGVVQWVVRYNGTGNSTDIATSLSLDNYGNIYVAGSSIGSASGDDFVTIKYDENGIQKWIQRYNEANGGDGVNSMVLDSAGNVYVTGYSHGNNTGIDFATIKYIQTVGIHTISSEIPAHYALLQNYPNPFNPSTLIMFDIHRAGDVKLVIYDALGREVITPVNEQLNAGTYQVEWNASDYSSGVYYYRLITGGFSDSRKMTLLK